MAQTCNCGPVEHKITEERLREIKKVSNFTDPIVVYESAEREVDYSSPSSLF